MVSLTKMGNGEDRLGLGAKELSFKCLCFLKKIFIFRERGREREREGEKHRCARKTSIGCVSYMPLTGDQTRNPGMCPDQELNQ